MSEANTMTRISLTLYRMLITQAVIAVPLITAFMISSSDVLLDDRYLFSLLAIVLGAFILVFVLFTVRRHKLVRLDDEKALPWWAAATINGVGIALVTVFLYAVLVR